MNIRIGGDAAELLRQLARVENLQEQKTTNNKTYQQSEEKAIAEKEANKFLGKGSLFDCRA